jgi:amino acid permease
VRFYGETEVFGGAVKVLCFLGLVVVSIVITAGGGPPTPMKLNEALTNDDRKPRKWPVGPVIPLKFVHGLLGLVVVSIVITAGGGPQGDAIGFRYWNNPGPWTNFNGITGLQRLRFHHKIAHSSN